MISNGQLANQTTFNNGFPSRTQDTSIAGRLQMQNALAESGAAIANPQREINGLCAFTGRTLASAQDSVPTYTTPVIIGVNDTLQAAIEKLDDEFNSLTGSLRARAGRYSVPDATSTVTISLGAAWADNNYVLQISVENLTDADPIFLQHVITARTGSNFTLKFNAPTDSANYVIHWSVRPQA